MSGTKPLLEISMGIQDFSSEWLNCDRLASYVARMVSHNRADPLLYANLLNSAVNELLETVFAHHGPEGTLRCTVSRSGEKDLIELTLPCDERALAFYTDAAQRLQRPDIGDVYHEALFSPAGVDPHLGLLEVAVDYQAAISIRPQADHAVSLTAEMALEGAA